MFNIGGGEMIMLAVLALLVFGPESLPDIAKTVSRTLRAFRQASSDLQSEVREALEVESKARKVPENPPAPKEDEVFEMAPREPKIVSPVLEQAAVDSPAVSPESNQVTTAEVVDEPSTKSLLNETVEGSPNTETVAAEENSDDDHLDDDGPGVPMAKHTLTSRAESEPSEVTA